MLIDFTVYCPLCGAETVVPVDSEAVKEWDQGALIQDAMPDLTAEQREALLTGICTPCWDKSFGE